MGQVSIFLGVEFTWKFLPDGHLIISLTQQSFTGALLDSLGVNLNSSFTFTTPYCSVVSINTIPSQKLSPFDQDRLRLQYQSLVGSLNWLAHTT
jgi:hypothetical protein